MLTLKAPKAKSANKHHTVDRRRAPNKSRHIKAKKRVAQLRAEMTEPRLLSKAEILAITGVSFPTIWKWMRDGSFPRSRIVGGKSMWPSDEIDAWRAGLPIRRLKGDAA